MAPSESEYLLRTYLLLRDSAPDSDSLQVVRMEGFQNIPKVPKRRDVVGGVVVMREVRLQVRDQATSRLVVDSESVHCSGQDPSCLQLLQLDQLG